MQDSEKTGSEESTFEEYVKTCTLSTWKGIAVGVDSTYASAIVFERALELAASTCSKLYVLHVVPTILPFAEKSNIAIDPGIEDVMFKETQELFDSIKKRMKERNVEGETILLEGDPATEILNFIKENKIGLMVLGSKERPKSPYYLGSVSKKVSEECSCSVLVERIS